MRVSVEPAKRREGASKVIFDEPLEQAAEISVQPDGDVTISFCAGGIYDRTSQYRYVVELSPRELAELRKAA